MAQVTKDTMIVELLQIDENIKNGKAQQRNSKHADYKQRAFAEKFLSVFSDGYDCSPSNEIRRIFHRLLLIVLF